jgi:hypothetical protein
LARKNSSELIGTRKYKEKLAAANDLLIGLIEFIGKLARVFVCSTTLPLFLTFYHSSLFSFFHLALVRGSTLSPPATPNRPPPIPNPIHPAVKSPLSLSRKSPDPGMRVPSPPFVDSRNLCFAFHFHIFPAIERAPLDDFSSQFFYSSLTRPPPRLAPVLYILCPVDSLHIETVCVCGVSGRRLCFPENLE